MKRLLSVALLGMASTAAWSLTDPVTGLSWTFVSGGAPTLTSYQNLATAAQVGTLITDLFGSNPASNTFSASGPNLFPSAYYTLEAALGSFVQYSAEGTYASFIAQSANGQPGYVDVGGIDGGYLGPSAGYPQGSYYYYAGISDNSPVLYSTLGGGGYAVALVSTVPETASWAMLAAGLGLGLTRWGRRGRNSHRKPTEDRKA